MVCTISTCCLASSSAAPSLRQRSHPQTKNDKPNAAPCSNGACGLVLTHGATNKSCRYELEMLLCAAVLRMGWSGRWRWLRGRRSLSSWIFRIVEIDLGSLTRAGLGFEVRVVTRKSGQAGDDVVGKQRDVGVVVLQDLIVVTTLDGDAIFRACQFILQAHKIFIGFELRIILDDHQQTPER